MMSAVKPILDSDYQKRHAIGKVEMKVNHNYSSK